MARSTKILQSFILRNLKLPYTCRENLTQSQISDFFSLNLTIFDQFWPKSQIRRKIAVLPPFWMIRHFFSRQNFSFFSSGIERPFYRFSTNVWFSRVISNGFGSNLLRNLGKTTESALFQRFSWYVEVIYTQTAQKWSSKLYTGRKLKERSLYSIGKKINNSAVRKMADHSKWRQNSYFPPNLVVIWVRRIQSRQIIPFFATAKSSPIQWTNPFWNLKTSKVWVCKGPPFEIWRFSKKVANIFMPTFEWNNWLFLKVYMRMNWRKVTNLVPQFCPPTPHPPPGLISDKILNTDLTTTDIIISSRFISNYQDNYKDYNQ